jgi:NAD(P)H-dependent flavin oxidoreductase YrpB (nitropropane dioxygenase family)
LNTNESELLRETKECFHAASSHDAIRTRSRTGKPVRMLRSRLTEAWEEPDAPAVLPMPLQTAVMAESRLRMTRARNKEFLTYPIGQIVGDMEHETTCRQVIQEMLGEFVDASERLNTLLTNE